MSKKEPPKTTDEKLDVIIDYLKQINHRDRLRMVGGIFRGLLGIIPMVIFLASIWYVYAYGDALLEKMAAAAARQASNFATINTSNLGDSFNIDTLMEQFRSQ